MKKIKAIALALTAVAVFGSFVGCTGDKKSEQNADGNAAILTYGDYEADAKHYNLVADIYKQSYLMSNGYSDEPVDESQYMTLKHILVQFEKDDGTVRTEEEALAEAQNIKAMITDDNFDELMAQYSEDPGSKSQPEGYTFAHDDGTMMQEFDDGGWALEVGQVSEPVRTSYGYHIIKRVELNKEGLPKTAAEINWDEELDPYSGEKAIDSIRESAYSWIEEFSILTKLAKDSGLSVTDEEYEDAKANVYQAMGGEEEAVKLFEANGYSEEDIKEFVEIYTLPNEYYTQFTESVNTEELFDEFIASDLYAEMVDYYAQMGIETNYTEYDAEDTELVSVIKSYAYDKMYNEEVAKVVKNEEVYNMYK